MRHILQPALALVPSISAQSTQDALAPHVAIKQAKAEDAKGARQTAKAARQAAEPAPDSFAKFVAATQRAHAGDVEGALQIAATISDESYKSAALRVIAAAQAKAGDVPEALRTASTIRDLGHQAYGLNEIAVAQRQAGDKQGALQTLKAARRVANAIPGPGKDYALKEIALQQGYAGDMAGAMETAGMISAHGTRDSALRYIAEAQVKAGDGTGALQTAAAISDPKTKASVLRRVNAVQTKAESTQEARQTPAPPAATGGPVTPPNVPSPTGASTTGLSESYQDRPRFAERLTANLLQVLVLVMGALISVKGSLTVIGLWTVTGWPVRVVGLSFVLAAACSLSLPGLLTAPGTAPPTTIEALVPVLGPYLVAIAVTVAVLIRARKH
jgi:hypothetical protein